jgi:hypothetical protein
VKAAALLTLLLCTAGVVSAGEGIPVRLASPSSGAAGHTFNLKDLPQVESSSCGRGWREPLSYLGLLPGLAALALLALRGRRWLAASMVCCLPLLLSLSADQRAAVTAGVQAFTAGEYARAERLFGDAERGAGCNAALAYDRALCSYALGRRAEAMAALLRSIRYEPGSAEYRDSFALLSAEYGLDSQVLPRGKVPPEALFAAAVVLANAAFVALGLLLARRARSGGSWFIAFALLALAAASAAGLLVYTEAEARAPLAVVSAESAPLRRVPLEQAQVWMTLPQGTSLRTRARASAYVLVETGLQVEGWIKGELLLDPAAP